MRWILYARNGRLAPACKGEELNRIYSSLATCRSIGGSMMEYSEDGNGITMRFSYSYSEEYIKNARGMRLFTCRWLPANPRQPIKALVFLCHGYAVECSVTMRGTGERLASAGYAVYGVDYEGHGRSDGIRGYVSSMDALVDDCDAFFTSVIAAARNNNNPPDPDPAPDPNSNPDPDPDDSPSSPPPLPRFLLGESMGGAVALLLHRSRPSFWSGAVLMAPMCKIADGMKPPKAVIRFLEAIATLVPRWKIVPTRDVIDAAYRTAAKRAEIRRNPWCYKGRPRLGTAHQLLTTSVRIEKEVLPLVSLPFLVVHGGADTVTDPAVSGLLHRTAASQDKTMKLYPGMWHALTSGELQENIDAVFADIVDWLDHRSSSSSPSVSRSTVA